MNKTPILERLFPKNFARYSGLPIFGSLMEDFAQWLQALAYSRRSTRYIIQAAWWLVEWLRRRRHVTSIVMVTPEVLAAAEAHFGCRHTARHAAQALRRFLGERQLIPEPKPAKPSPSQTEVNRYALHLREVRGLAEGTICNHRQFVTRFWEFIGFDRKKSTLSGLKHEQIEAFVRQVARTRTRRSLLPVVLTLRAFLRFEFSRGVLARPLHEQIDTPRVYSGEQLPCVLTREQVKTFLKSIDRSNPTGLRDFTMLYLIAAYGLRRSEVVKLHLEDIDWRNRILHVKQPKTHQVLPLPLTDEAGQVLVRYLRRARPCTERRELFLRSQAPAGPLTPWAVNLLLLYRLRRSGLDLGKFGPHALRYSLAVHLLRRGVSMTSIGDTLGHRDLRSTAQYLRLNVDDLRLVGLPVPKPAPAARLLTEDWHARFPRVGSLAGPRPRAQTCFRSAFASALKRFLVARRTLGRKYVTEESSLRSWDTFLDRQKTRVVDHALFCLWAKSLSHLNPKSQVNHLRVVRDFLAYDAREHPGNYVPDRAIFPKLLPPRPPRLVSAAEMASLLATAATLGHRASCPLRPHTVRIGLMLLFCCGLRIGELLGLQLRHYEAADRLLRIEGAKFNKSRLVPLAPSVAQALERYLEQRRSSGVPTNPESVLMWCGRLPEPKAAYNLTSFTDIWKRLCLSAGVIDERGRPPRLHDLRHSFAVEALHRWYAQGGNVQSRLPYLATYLGHIGPASSHYYLQLTPALRSAASQRFHRAFGRLAKTGGAL